jgi:hypothetical protein
MGFFAHHTPVGMATGVFLNVTRASWNLVTCCMICVSQVLTGVNFDDVVRSCVWYLNTVESRTRT